jgi:hypothetical protein
MAMSEEDFKEFKLQFLEKEQGNLGFQLLPKKKLKVSCTRKIDAGSCRKMSEPFPGYTGTQTFKKP